MTLLTTDELRQHVTTTLGDDALQRLLDAAEFAITQEAGPTGEITYRTDGGESIITLPYRAASIASIIETIYQDALTLDTTDWRLDRDLVSLARLDTGTHPSQLWYQRRRLGGSRFLDQLEIGRWAGSVAITYTPVDDTVERIRCQIALVKLDLNSTPGVISERIGDWSEQKSPDASYDQARDAILASLRGDTWEFA